MRKYYNAIYDHILTDEEKKMADNLAKQYMELPIHKRPSAGDILDVVQKKLNNLL